MNKYFAGFVFPGESCFGTIYKQILITQSQILQAIKNNSLIGKVIECRKCPQLNLRLNFSGGQTAFK